MYESSQVSSPEALSLLTAARVDYALAARRAQLTTWAIARAFVAIATEPGFKRRIT